MHSSHAATMVTAGVYLVVRCCDIFEVSNLSLFFVDSDWWFISFVWFIDGRISI